MGPPTTTCCVCQQTVLKSKTRHIGDGQRACLIHDGIEQKAHEAQQKITAQAAENRQPKRPWRSPPKEEEPFVMLPSCCICGDHGLREDEFYMRLLIAHKQLELKGEFSLLDPQATRRQMNLPPEVKTIIRVYTAEMLSDEQFARVTRHCKRELRNLLEGFGFTGICLPCAEKLELPDPHKPMKEVDLKQLALLGTLIDPALTEIAQRTMPLSEVVGATRRE